MPDINAIISQPSPRTRYGHQIKRIQSNNKSSECIEQAVTDAIKNIKDQCHSFVIYGEPQSGKTEMMIVLTARLLDEGYKIIVVGMI